MKQALLVKLKFLRVHLRLFLGGLRSLKFRENPLVLWRQIRALRELVDDDFYYANYPDVKEHNIPAFIHFIVCGYAEQKKPNPYVNTEIFQGQISGMYPKGMYPLLYAARENILSAVGEAKTLIHHHTGTFQELKDAAFPSDDKRVVAWYLPNSIRLEKMI